jgi:hypothetical protein
MRIIFLQQIGGIKQTWKGKEDYELNELHEFGKEVKAFWNKRENGGGVYKE